jgi:hypothetical protein
MVTAWILEPPKSKQLACKPFGFGPATRRGVNPNLQLLRFRISASEIGHHVELVGSMHGGPGPFAH